MIAARKGDIHMLQLVIQHGADPYTTDHKGRSALHYALHKAYGQKYRDIAQYLLTHLQLDPNIKNQSKQTPFLIATLKGDIKMLHILSQHGANPNIKDGFGHHPIHYAVEKHRYDIFEYLITYLHLDPNAQDHRGNTPLHIALQRIDYDTAQTLIQLGANLHIPNHQGKTPSSISSLYQIQLRKPQPSTITF